MHRTLSAPVARHHGDPCPPALSRQERHRFRPWPSSTVRKPQGVPSQALLLFQVRQMAPSRRRMAQAHRSSRRRHRARHLGAKAPRTIRDHLGSRGSGSDQGSRARSSRLLPARRHCFRHGRAWRVSANQIDHPRECYGAHDAGSLQGFHCPQLRAARSPKERAAPRVMRRSVIRANYRV